MRRSLPDLKQRRMRFGVIVASVIAALLMVLPHLDLLGGGIIPIGQALVPTAITLILLSVVIVVLINSARLARFRYLDRKRWRRKIRGIAGAQPVGLRQPVELPNRPHASWWLIPLILATGATIGAVPVLNRQQPDWATPDLPRQSIKVLSLNVQFSGADVAALRDVMAAHEPQIVIFLEVDEDFLTRLAATGALDLTWPLAYRTGSTSSASSGASGTIILSAWPLSELGEVPSVGWPGNDSGFMQPTATVSIPDSNDVRLAAVHPPPPVIAGAQPWRDGLREIADWLVSESVKTPAGLIIAGDFNASTAHPAFRDKVAGLSNTAVAARHLPTWVPIGANVSRFSDPPQVAGYFPIPTWPANSLMPPFTAIDHILVRYLWPANWHRFSVPGTDHYGVIAEVLILRTG